MPLEILIRSIWVTRGYLIFFKQFRAQGPWVGQVPLERFIKLPTARRSSRHHRMVALGVIPMVCAEGWTKLLSQPRLKGHRVRRRAPLRHAIEPPERQAVIVPQRGQHLEVRRMLRAHGKSRKDRGEGGAGQR